MVFDPGTIADANKYEFEIDAADVSADVSDFPLALPIPSTLDFHADLLGKTAEQTPYAFDAASSGYTNHTLTIVFDLDDTDIGLDFTAGQFRLWFDEYSTGTSWNWTKCYAQVADSSDDYDFVSTPVEVTQSGTSGGSSGTSGAWSDWINLPLKPADKLVVRFHTTAGNPSRNGSPGSLSAIIGQGQQSGDTADDVSWGGSTSAGSVYGVSGIQLRNAIKKLSVDIGGTQCPVEVSPNEWNPGGGYVEIDRTAGSTYGQEHPSYTGRAFDGATTDPNATGSWYAYSGGWLSSGYVGKDYGSGNEKTVTRLGIYNESTANAAKDFTLEGSNDASSWTTLLTVTDASQTTAWVYHEVSNTTAYRYYRVNVSANRGGGYCIVRELAFFEDEPPSCVLYTKIPSITASGGVTGVLSWDETQDDNDDYVGLTTDHVGSLIENELASNREGTGWNTYCHRLLIPAAEIDFSGNKVKFKFMHNNTDYVVTSCHIGEWTGSGPNMVEATISQITSGGSGTWTVTSDGQESDVIDVEIDPSKSYIFALNSSTSQAPIDDSGGTATNYVGYEKSGQVDTGQATATGFSSYSGKALYFKGMDAYSPHAQVWNDGYDRVYHFANGTAECLDSTGNQNDQTAISIASEVDANIGTGLDFNGSAYVTTPNHGLGTGDVAGSIQALINPDNVATAFQAIFSTGVHSSLQTFGLGIAAGTFGAQFNGGNSFNETTGSMSNDTWQAIGFSKAAGVINTTTTLFKDGAEVAGSGSASTPNIGAGVGRIGYWTASGYNYDGSMAELRLSTVARSDAYMVLEQKSLLNNLLTWSAYSSSSGGVALLAWFEQPYNLTDPMRAWLEQPYGMAIALASYLEQPYSFLLQTYLVQYYGDVRQLKAWLIQRYGDVAQLKTWLEQKYGDSGALMAWLEQPYQFPAILEAALIQRYGLGGAQLAAALLQAYDINQHRQLTTSLLQPYLLQGLPAARAGDPGDPPAHRHDFVYELSLAGQAVSPHVINWDYRRSRFYGTISMSFKRQEQAQLAEDLAPIVLTFGGQQYHFEVEGGFNESSGFGSLVYTVEGHSKVKRLGAPHAAPVNGKLDSAWASAMFQALADPYGVTIDYQITDEWLDDIEASNETPAEIMQRILPDEAKLQPTPAGDTLRVVWEYETSIPSWRTIDPAATIDDLSGFSSTSESSDIQKGYNKFVVIDQETAEDNTNLVQEQIDEHTIEVRLYLSPWSDLLQFELDHTGGSWVSIEPFGGDNYEELTETVEFIDGSGSTARPVDEVLTTEWLEDDLGAVTPDDDGLLTAARQRVWNADQTDYTGGDSLLEITYRARYWRWIVRNPRSESVQVVARRITQ